MQRIERYGVIALVFLLVTVAAVSFWGEGRDEKPTPEQETVAQVPTRNQAAPSTPASNRPRVGRNENQRESNSSVPLSPRPGGETVDLAPSPAAPADSAPQGTPRNPRGRQRPTQRGSRGAQDTILGEEVAELEGDPYRWSSKTPDRELRVAPGAERPETRLRELSSEPVPTPSQPTIASTAPTSGSGGFFWHDVLPNETLSEIAVVYLGKASRWREIQTINAGLTPESLRSGTRIKIPGGAGAATSPARNQGSKPATPRAASGGVYVVKAGDTLSRIAARELGSVGRMSEIIAMNPGMNPDVVVLGARLNMPGGAPAPASRSIAQATPPAATEPRRTAPRGPRVR